MLVQKPILLSATLFMLSGPVTANDLPRPFTEIKHAVETVSDQVEALDAKVDALTSDLSGLEAKVDALSATVDGVATDVASLQATVDMVAADTALLASTLQLSVAVDTEACASAAVQCSVDGTGAADSGNHSPIRLFVHVSQNGQPVTGLTLDDFGLTVPFVPAGGAATVICEEAVCGPDRFQAQAGVYTLWLDRGPAGNWLAGSYAGSLTVVTADSAGAELVNFTLPAAP